MKYTGMSIPGWTAIMATVLLLGAIQFLILGIQGLYIGAIHSEVKGRPNYIIRNTIGLDDECLE